MPQHTIKRREWTHEEDTLLRDLMSTKKLSFRQMALHFVGRNAGSLRKRARTHLGLAHGEFIFRKHSYNQAFFAVPNPINCYVAGFYAADGYIGDNPTTRVLTISLAEPERHQVETFKRLLGYSGKVQFNPQRAGCANQYALRLYGAHQITADLERVFGLTPRKTYRIPVPNLTDPHLQLCYLAGLLDGDGCVNISNRDRLIVRYVSCSETIVNWVKVFTDSLGLVDVARNTRKPCVKPVWGHAHAWGYQLGGAKAIDLIKRIQRLKVEGVPILDRKWDNPRINAYINTFCVKHGLLLDVAA